MADQPDGRLSGLAQWIVVNLLDRGVPAERAQAVASVVDYELALEESSNVTAGVVGALRERGVRPEILSRVDLIVARAMRAASPQGVTAYQPPRAASLQRISIALIVVVAGVFLAYAAQSLFEDAAFRATLSGAPVATPAGLAALNRLAAGMGLYCLAGVLFAVGSPVLGATLPGPLQTDVGRARPNVLRVILMGLALAAYGFQLWQTRTGGENDAVRALWAASLVMLALTALRLPGDERGLRLDDESSPPFRTVHVCLLFALLIGAAATRIYQLEDNMLEVTADFGNLGNEARQYLLGNSADLFRTGWAGIPPLTFAQEAIPMALFGNNLFGSRMAGVIAGVTSIGASYLLIWRLSDNHRLAFLTAAFLAVSPLHLFFSRVPANMAPLANSLLGMYFMVDGMRARRTGSFALAGICVGTSFQLYASSRALPFFLVPFVAGLLVVRRPWLTRNIPGFGVMCLSLIITMGAWILSDSRTINTLTERAREVSMLESRVRDYYQAELRQPTVAGLIMEQIGRSLLAFNVYPDNSPAFKFPHTMFAASVSPLVLLGIAYCIRHVKRPLFLFALIWWMTTLTFGSILTNLPPTWQRLAAVAFAGALFGAIALEAMIEAISRVINSQLARFDEGGARRVPYLKKGIQAFGVALVAILLIGNGAHAFGAVLDFGARLTHREAAGGRVVYGLPASVNACGVTGPIDFHSIEFKFLAYPRVVVPFSKEEAAAEVGGSALARCVGRAVVWLLSPDHESLLDQIRIRWPGGQLEQHLTPDGKPWFKSYLALKGSDLASMTRSQAADVIAALVPIPPGIANYASYSLEGLPFAPERKFLGNTQSVPYEISLGKVLAAGGRISLRVGMLPVHSAVYDYVRLVDSSGREFRFEAEDERHTTGDRYAKTEGLDGHWWLQGYSGFGGGKGLVAVAGEVVPVLTTSVELPPGEYDVYVGSFTGSKNQGVFGLGLTIK